MDGVLREVTTGSEAPAEPDGCTRAVLVFEPGASATVVRAALDALARYDCTAIVHAPADVDAFQELIDGDRLFYLSRGELSERDLRALLRGALATQAPEAPPVHARDLRRFALAQSVSDFAEALRTAAADAVQASRTRCVLFDRERRVLWIPNESDGESPAAGVTSFILRTGQSVCLARIGDDPRCDVDLDAPGDEASRFLGVAVRNGSEVVAVLIALRAPHEPPFEPRDVAALETLALHAAPYVAPWLAESDGPFRRDALRELEQPMFAGPEPLRLDGQWLRRASWLAVAAFVALVLALLFVRVPQYASATGVVGADGAVVATIPSSAIERGMPMRFANQSARVARVNGDVVVSTPLAHARPGTRGPVEVRVGAERLLFVILPRWSRAEGRGLRAEMPAEVHPSSFIPHPCPGGRRVAHA